MDRLVVFTLALKDFVQQIFAHRWYSMLAMLFIFIASLVFFAATYHFLDHFYRVGWSLYKGKRLQGFTIAGEGFVFSDLLRSQTATKARNDLRLRSFMGRENNVAWQSFRGDRIFSASLPDRGDEWKEFHEIQLRGLSAIQMVGDVFGRYGQLSYSIVEYRDNHLEQTMPISVLIALLQRDPIQLQEEVANRTLAANELKLFDELRSVAAELKQNLFRSGSSGKLFFLKNNLMSYADKVEATFGGSPYLRECFLGEVLATLAPPTTAIEFDFDSLPLVPTFTDFVYLSTVIGTGNIPSEMTPVVPVTRFAVWTQLIFSYLLLGLFVGVASNLFGK